MKKNAPTISNPDELNKYLQHSSPVTWIILGSVVALLLAFFGWTYFGRIPAKISGEATLVNGVATLRYNVSEEKKLVIGQKVLIDQKEGKLLSFADGEAQASSFELSDGAYTYYVVVAELRPIDWLWSK